MGERSPAQAPGPAPEVWPAERMADDTVSARHASAPATMTRGPQVLTTSTPCVADYMPEQEPKERIPRERAVLRNIPVFNHHFIAALGTVGDGARMVLLCDGGRNLQDLTGAFRAAKRTYPENSAVVKEPVTTVAFNCRHGVRITLATGTRSYPLGLTESEQPRRRGRSPLMNACACGMLPSSSSRTFQHVAE